MRASLFIACFNDIFFPQTGRAVVSLLRRLGVEIAFDARQTCCGQMHANSGYRPEAWHQAERFLRLYTEADHVVIPSTSCTAMIREQYPALFAAFGSESQKRELAALLPRVSEFSEFLIDKLGSADVGAYFPHRVAYHASCHGLRALRLGDRPYQLLAKVRGLELVELPNTERCCGFGGTFAVNNAEVSSAMLTAKLQDVLSTRAEICTALDNSCLMHLGGALHRQYAGMTVMHLAEILVRTETSFAEAAS
ncbi:MAG: (Fe-S)-binding protein [Rhizomicrobium sp.]|nr:(Fe-S)-binding protein [Rhizomicrobium sp.]